MNIFKQTPASILDYTVNWANYGLGTDTISTSTWAVSTASDGSTLTTSSPTNTNTTTTIWLTGGNADNFYTVTNTIVTAGGREIQESFVINVVANIFI